MPRQEPGHEGRLECYYQELNLRSGPIKEHVKPYGRKKDKGRAEQCIQQGSGPKPVNEKGRAAHILLQWSRKETAKSVVMSVHCQQTGTVDFRCSRSEDDTLSQLLL